MPSVDHSTTVPDLKAASSQPPPIVTNKMPSTAGPPSGQWLPRRREIVAPPGGERFSVSNRPLPPGRAPVSIASRLVSADRSEPTSGPARTDSPTHPAKAIRFLARRARNEEASLQIHC